ncbi:hypothetical protein MRBLMI12_000493 [Microbacterium sp. LMI12-1-1.1]|uniref:hypothetical protein n=1 Tax=Microbacterium sp. LMI12-1-1.1 TaxID=3135225 RepID=UPI00341917BE
MKSVKLAAVIGAIVIAATVTACSPQPQPESIPKPEKSTEATTEAVETPEAEEPAAAVGTRENPVPIGQMLAFEEGSAFQVGASAPTQVTPTYSVLPLAIQIDWTSMNSQLEAQGQPTGGPVTPWTNFRVLFVTADGKTYDTMDDYTVTIDNQLFDIGDIYEGTDLVNANEPISVPEAEVAGGVWVIENMASGKRVFIAAQ